jgi:hypothetical protein
MQSSPLTSPSRTQNNPPPPEQCRYSSPTRATQDVTAPIHCAAEGGSSNFQSTLSGVGVDASFHQPFPRFDHKEALEDPYHGEMNRDLVFKEGLSTLYFLLSQRSFAHHVRSAPPRFLKRGCV